MSTAQTTTTTPIQTTTTASSNNKNNTARSETTKNKMKAIQIHDFISDFESIDDSKMTLNNNISIPTLKKDDLLIKVLSCSIFFGDVITVHGNLIFLHEKFPFIPGMDVCGIVEDVNGCTEKFQKGDIVVASNGVSTVGGMAEYMAVSSSEAVRKPPTVDVNEAAASSSAITAHHAVMDNVCKGDRVLILGGSGGVGSAAIQIAKSHAGASFVAATSSQIDFCKKLGADQIINYKTGTTIWWEIDWEEKFDVIIDTVGGGNFYGKAEKVLKSNKEGGRFVAVCGDDPTPDCCTVWEAVKFFAKMPWRPLYTWLRGSIYAKYVTLMPYNYAEGRKVVLGWMQDGTLKIPLDEQSPLPFTIDGVRKAFQVVASGRAHGKVVVSMEK